MLVGGPSGRGVVEENLYGRFQVKQHICEFLERGLHPPVSRGDLDNVKAAKRKRHVVLIHALDQRKKPAHGSLPAMNVDVKSTVFILGPGAHQAVAGPAHATSDAQDLSATSMARWNMGSDRLSR